VSLSFVAGPVLGIETSCDETAVAVVDGGVVIAEVIATQIPIHRRFGGVVPEVASRNHLLTILPVIEQTLTEANLVGTDLHGIAVTNRPGLIGALLVGVQTAKTLALVWNLPIIGVHHIHAHCTAAWLRAPDEAAPQIALPALALAVSGGHTSLLAMYGPTDLRPLGATLDDAAGEALDKFGKLLGLPYPAGPEIDHLAKQGDDTRFKFPDGMRGRDDLAMSFSGLKTAGRQRLEALCPNGAALDNQTRADLCASYQRAAVQQLVTTTMRAAERSGLRTIVVAGGVAANSVLRRELEQAAADRGLQCWLAPKRWCTDNGAMIAGLGSALLAAGGRDDATKLDAKPTAKRQPQRNTKPGVRS
jgi:N6-L-threonylcarbamoyladenine synthase